MGNPLGALVYSTGLPSGDNTTLQQAISWNNFVGSGQFCIKVCDPSVVHPNYCYKWASLRIDTFYMGLFHMQCLRPDRLRLQHARCVCS